MLRRFTLSIIFMVSLGIAAPSVPVLNIALGPILGVEQAQAQQKKKRKTLFDVLFKRRKKKAKTKVNVVKPRKKKTTVRKLKKVKTKRKKKRSVKRSVAATMLLMQMS